MYKPFKYSNLLSFAFLLFCGNCFMLRTRTLDAFLGQVVGGAVAGVLLFNKDGLTVSRTAGDTSRPFSGNVYSALLANIWETFERQGVRDELREVIIACDRGTVVLTRVASMLLAVMGTEKAPLGILLIKLHALVEQLKVPLSAITPN